MSGRPDAGFPNDSTLPLLAAFVLALGFLGAVVAIVSGGGSPSNAGAAGAMTTETQPTRRTPTTPAAPDVPVAQVTLVLSAAGDGRGRVRVRGELRDCSEEDCRVRYDQGATATLVARPSEGSTFVGWTGSCGSPATCRVKMDGARSLTALFASNERRPPPSSLDEECSDSFDNDDDGDVDDEDIDCLDGDTEEPQDVPLPDVPPPPVVAPQPAPVMPPPPPPPPPAAVQPPAEP